MGFALSVLLLGCESAVDPDADVSWSGWVYVDQDPEQVLTGGTVDFWVDGWSGAVAASEPYAEDYGGFWEVLLPPAVAVNVRVAQAGGRPTWWAGDVPSTRANWFGGALFAGSDAWLAMAFSSLGEDDEAWLSAAAEGVLVFGYPANDGLLCGDLLVGVPAAPEAPLCWVVDESGVLRVGEAADPVSWFAAMAEPGEVVVNVAGATEVWTAEAGEVILPWYLFGGGS